MSYISQLYLPGALTLWCALIFSLASIWGYTQVLRGDSGAAGSLIFARRAYNFFALAVALSGLLLGLLLLMRDFRIEYVFQYSGLDLPVHYQFAAFWAGQKGSFLIWLIWGSLLGLGIKAAAGKDEAAVMPIYTLTLLGLLFILVRENPFVMLKETPLDGTGLNPLLQDDWMVIHPPIMFIGYAASAIPFAFAMASLWRKDYDNWAARAFPWALGGFLVLGTAILMGGYWAYKTLGWGGYWGWDPVENASLIPWLFGTVMIHGLHMERTKGRYRRANYVLAGLTYISVLYGTFLTRSGVLADFSVHSFVDLGISGWLTFLLGGFTLLWLALLGARWKQIPTEVNEDPQFLSRGTFLVLSTITILVATIMIAVGTSAPLLTKFMENPGQVGPEFYNRVNFPIALLISVLLAIVPYLTWRGISGKELVRKLIVPGIFALIVAVAAAVWQVHNPFHLLFVFLAALALATNFDKTVAKMRAGGLRSGGGYLAHVGVGVILLGVIASSAYDQSAKVTLEQGVPRKLGDLTLTFERFIPRQGFEREKMEVRVVKADGEKFTVYPRLFMNERTKQVMVHPDIRKTPLQDLYVSPIDFDPGRPSLQLAQGEEGAVGNTQIRFVSFDLNADGNAIAQMEGGQPITIGAVFDVTRGGQTARVKPLYRLNPIDGSVEAPPLALPGGGQIYVAGINASSRAVQVGIEGVASRPKLSVDVTHKPLINLVWWGLYVVLAGGILSTIQRIREVRLRDRLVAGANEE